MRFLFETFLFWKIVYACFYLEICSSLNFKVLSITTWHDAVASCEDFGMKLATIKSQMVQTEIDGLIEDGAIDSSFEYWIGLYWRADNQSFFWIDGEEKLFSNWDIVVGDPNNMQAFSYIQEDNLNENCVRIVNGLWRTHECNKEHHVLCMKFETTNSLTSTFKDATTSLSRAGDQARLPTTTAGHKARSVTTDNTKGSTSSTNPSDGPIVSTDPMTTTWVTADVSVHMAVQTDTELTTFTNDSLFNTTMSGTRAIVFCPIQASSICECKIIQNISVVVNGEAGDYIYRIDKQKTSAYRRKHNSARDGRFSARCIGLTGSAVLVVVVLSIIVLDIKRMPNNNQKKN